MTFLLPPPTLSVSSVVLISFISARHALITLAPQFKVGNHIHLTWNGCLIFGQITRTTRPHTKSTKARNELLTRTKTVARAMNGGGKRAMRPLTQCRAPECVKWGEKEWWLATDARQSISIRSSFTLRPPPPPLPLRSPERQSFNENKRDINRSRHVNLWDYVQQQQVHDDAVCSTSRQVRSHAI